MCDCVTNAKGSLKNLANNKKSCDFVMPLNESLEINAIWKISCDVSFANRILEIVVNSSKNYAFIMDAKRLPQIAFNV